MREKLGDMSDVIQLVGGKDRAGTRSLTPSHLVHLLPCSW